MAGCSIASKTHPLHVSRLGKLKTHRYSYINPVKTWFPGSAGPTVITANRPSAAFRGICYSFLTQTLVYGCHTSVSDAKSPAAAHHVSVFPSSMVGHVKEVQVVDEAMPFGWNGSFD